MDDKHLFLFLLLTLLSLSHNIHARDVKMFNKVPSKINENVVLKENEVEVVPNDKDQEQQQQPNFIPENENSYGLYGHESGQLPPSTTTSTTVSPATTTTTTTKEPLSKYLPKNYNPVAYVTEPEDFSDDSSSFMDKTYTTTDNNNNNNNGENNFNNNGENSYYNGMKDSEPMMNNKEHTTTDNIGGNNYYNNGENNYYNNNNNGGNNYNNVPVNGMMSDTRFTEKTPAKYNDWYGNGGNNGGNIGGTRFMDKAYTTTAAAATTTTNNNNDFYTGGRVNRVQQQGMSDTRFLHNGRYFYDIKAEKYSLDPYKNSKEIGLNNNEQFNTRGFNYYNNVENSYQNNNYMDDQEQYQDEEDLP